MPTVSIRVTPAASAAATSSALGASHRSQMGVGVDHAGELLGRLGKQRVDARDALARTGPELPAAPGERELGRAERAEQRLVLPGR